MGKPTSKKPESGQLHLRVPMETITLIDKIADNFEKTVGIRPLPGNVVTLGIKTLAERVGILGETERTRASSG
jgi:hypothetical protein